MTNGQINTGHDQNLHYLIDPKHEKNWSGTPGDFWMGCRFFASRLVDL